MADDADVIIAGGAEAAITPMGVGGFAAMRALNKKNFMGQFISVSEAINSTPCSQVKQAYHAYQNMMVAG